ncbi:MAG: fluoroacetyl-CoA thioesterase [Actinomycetota bacterium]|jgi:predicted thioesterase|nr:fluoroacetyl-CoA thioesterase [Actinomycetota bacterium]
MPIEPGVTGRVEHTVSDEDTALSMGSGQVPVLGTPRVVAWAEEACCLAVRDRLGEGETTVGMRVQLDHLAPVAVGHAVTSDATVERVDGRRITFTVSVTDAAGLVAAGKVTRAIVTTESFLQKAR